MILLRLITFPLVTLLIFSTMADDDPFADENQEYQEPPRPERNIRKMPKSVSYELESGCNHLYTIHNIYTRYARETHKEKDEPAFYSSALPRNSMIRFDLKKKTCVFTIPRKLTLSELAYVIDDYAFSDGVIPTWLELEARDREKSKNIDGLKFSLKAYEEHSPEKLAWFRVPRETSISQSFRPFSSLASPELTLRLIPSTAMCICHSRYSLRILDETGAVLWLDDQHVSGSVRFALTDIDGDRSHDILLQCDDHGLKSRNFVLQKEK